MQRPGVQDTGIGQIHGGPAKVVAGGSTFEVDEIDRRMRSESRAARRG